MFVSGDIVSRKSYNNDILFKIIGFDINKRTKKINKVILKGIDLRIIADSDIEDLVLEDNIKTKKYMEKSFSRGETKIKEIAEDKTTELYKTRNNNNENNMIFNKTPKILHIDGDHEYLKLCMENYKKVGLKAVGMVLAEKSQPKCIIKLLETHDPDILVLTGHDSMIKNASNHKDLRNYMNSSYFIESVRNARHYEPNLDQLIIFAGACQSYFEGLVEVGANFASSPERVLIHALDPLLIVEQIAFTPTDKIADTKTIISNTITGLKGVGGIQTKGKLRIGMPKTMF